MPTSSRNSTTKSLEKSPWSILLLVLMLVMVLATVLAVNVAVGNSKDQTRDWIALTSVLGTVLASLVAIILAIENRRLADAPRVVLFVGPNERDQAYLDISVENSGNGPAYDIKFDIQRVSSMGAPIQFDRIIPFIESGIRYLPAGKKISHFLDVPTFGQPDWSIIGTSPTPTGVRERKPRKSISIWKYSCR